MKIVLKKSITKIFNSLSPAIQTAILINRLTAIRLIKPLLNPLLKINSLRPRNVNRAIIGLLQEI